MNCKKCGRTLIEGEEFCGNCGAKVEPEVSVPVQEPNAGYPNYAQPAPAPAQNAGYTNYAQPAPVQTANAGYQNYAQPAQAPAQNAGFPNYPQPAPTPAPNAGYPYYAQPAPAPVKDKKTKKTEKPVKAAAKKKGGNVIAGIAVIAAMLAALTCLFFFVIKPLFLSKKTEADPEPFAIEQIYADVTDIETDTTADVFVTVKLAEHGDDEITITDEDQNSFGKVNDLGKNGDAIAGDGLYCGTITMTSSKAAPINIYAFNGTSLSEKYETIYFYPGYQSSYYQEYTRVDEAVSDIAYSYGCTEDAKDAIDAKLKDMQKNGEVKSYTYDHGCFTVKLPSGGSYVYCFEPGGDFKSGPSGAPSYDSSTAGLYTISPNTNTVASLQPYKHELSYSGTDTSAYYVTQSPYDYVLSANLDNQEVSVEVMKSLNKYNVIILDGHGGYSNSLHSFFGIGTVVSPENDRTYWADIYYDRLIHLSKGQYGVTAAFFDHHYRENDFGETLIYLGCCHGADDNVLADSLFSKGVDAIYAYRNSVSVDYDVEMMTSIFSSLSQSGTPVTVSQALQTAQSRNGVTDDTNAHWYNWLFGNYETEANRARLYLVEGSDADFTLNVETSTLRGKVADSGTGFAVFNAVVSAVKDGSDVSVGNVKTDETGDFKFPLEEGTYTITVQAGGFLPCTLNNIVVEKNSTTYLQNIIMLEQKDGTTSSVIGGKVTNAVTGEAASGVTVKLRKDYNNVSGDYVKDSSGRVITVTSGRDGSYLLSGLSYGYYTLEVSKDGFVTQHVNVFAADSAEARSQNVVISPEASGSDFRITLQWGADPRDEDSHVYSEDPTNFHLYYNNQDIYSGGELIASLDHDDVNGNGFETVTLQVSSTGTYHYFVHHYEGEGSLSTSNAIVKVYQGGVMIRQYNVPTDQGTGRVWNVFKIVNGEVITINRISDNPLCME